MYNQHGGDLDAIEREHGIPRDRIIDFSGNINPLGAPASVRKAITENIHMLSTYPDRSYLKLRRAISSYTGIDSDNILVGNGSTELISLFIKMVAPQKAVVIAPAYSEYQRELGLLGSEILLFPLQESEGFKLNIDALLKTLNESVKLLVICNPNNPTGSASTRQELEQIFEHCKKSGIWVMVDETYAEFTESDISSLPLIKLFDNVFTICGTSKFFAVPGLRLGYGCCSNIEFLQKLHSQKDPWSVNILSSIGGEAMFYDREYIQETKELIDSERKRMLSELSLMPGIKVYESKSNFILIKLVNTKLNSHEIATEMLKKSLLVRDASSFDFLDESFLRFCVLSPKNNSFLLKELSRLLQS